MRFVHAVASGDWAGCIKQLDAELQKVTGDTNSVPLLLNRGYCHQKLMLNRKALKVFAIDMYPRKILAPRSCMATIP